MSGRQLPNGTRYARLPRHLIESNDWSALHINTRRLVYFLLIGHSRLDGKQNGNLKAPVRQLVSFGIDAKYIGEVILEAELRGFITVQRGGMRVASLYALTPKTLDIPAGAQFVLLPIDLLCSPAWRALGINEHRTLDAMILDHLRQGGRHNGQIKATYDQLVHRGVHRESIPQAIRNLESGGIIDVHRVHRSPSTYTLTWLRANGTAATNRWLPVAPGNQKSAPQSRTQSAPQSRTQSGESAPQSRTQDPENLPPKAVLHSRSL